MSVPTRPNTPALSARTTVLVAAAGVLLVIGLVVALMWATQWTYSSLRQQASLPSAERALPHGPAVIGPRDERAASAGTSAPSGPAGPPSGVDASTPPTLPRGAAAGLAIPVDGVSPEALYPSFDEARGSRVHEAIDIMAPRGTPVRAVAHGRIAKLFASDAGGLTIYQFDSNEQLAYYYAHLDRYEPGLAEGDEVRRGDLLAYVGSTGNASRDAPHLHFAVFVLGPEKRWWEGRPIDPYPLLGGTAR